MKTKLIALAANLMFKLSLGSKELFHSNFLGFLWELDKTKFINMLRDILGQPQLLATITSNLELDREKRNFDICIYHKDVKKEIIDIIIENKVKSIPYKEQLDKYTSKVGPSTVRILLSLAKNFPSYQDIKNAGWEIITYDDLAKGIKIHYGQLANKYIDDYIDFIAKLDKLDILDNFKNQTFYDSDLIDLFGQHRLSDLYIKQRGSYFISLLKQELGNVLGGTFDVVFGSDVKNLAAKKNTILLKSEMYNGKSTITICIKLLNSNNLYEIQIEGDQYRHLLNHNGLIAKRVNNPLVESILSTMPYFDFSYFPNKLVSSNSKNYFNQYKPNCMYRYMKLPSGLSSGLLVSDMLDIIVDDTMKVIGYLPQCENIAKGL